MIYSLILNQQKELNIWETKFENQKIISEDKKMEELHQQILKEKGETQKRMEDEYQQMKRKEEEYLKRIEELTKKLNVLEKSQQDMDRKKLEEEKKLQEEQRKKEKERMRQEEEMEKKLKEYELLEKWKSRKAPDFEEDIFKAVAQGKLTSIVYLLANGINVNEHFRTHSMKDKVTGTPLHFAAYNGHLCVVKYLCNQKADINAKNYRTLF